MHVIKVPAHGERITKWRFRDKEWDSLYDAPAEFRGEELSNFEVLFNGEWTAIDGAYITDDGVMIWIDKTGGNRMRIRKWHLFDPTKGSRQKLPLRRKYVLVRLRSEGIGESDPIVVGYRKNHAGDKQSPYFVTPGSAYCGKPYEWCDCLPEGFEWPMEREDVK